MAGRNSQQEQSGVEWQTVGIKLGTAGLDLRQPSDPGALTRLLNARFLDDRTVEQRLGHAATLLCDASAFPALGSSFDIADQWVYGHGQRVSSANAASWENAHHPIARRGEATFRFDDTDVVWTGDRLLVVREEGPALGGSAFWGRSTNTTPVYKGTPAYLPLQTDSTPPALVSGNYVETCLTSRYRVFVHTSSSGLEAWILDRDTNAVIDHSVISGASVAPVEPRVINSNDIVVVVWRDTTDGNLYRNYWTGFQWTGLTTLQATCNVFDVAPVSGGFYIVFRYGSTSVKYIRFTGVTSLLSADLGVGSLVPNAGLACGVSPDGIIGVLLESTTGLWAGLWNPAGGSPIALAQTNAATGWTSGLSIVSRGLKESTGRYKWVVHASRGSANGTIVRQFSYSGSSISYESSVTRFNSCLASKSFRVGDEVFCWLRSSNAGTHYLIGGAGQLLVCGFADREEAITRTNVGNYGVPLLGPDPRDEDGATFTWARPYNTGQSYAHGGNVRVGDLDFLPALSVVSFGRSTYLSGSAVTNYDGVQLGDAGFQDYPVVSSSAESSGGSLTFAGQYNYRVYAVRYNARGERFQSAAVTYVAPVLTTGSKITLTIATLPDTNHSDVVFEVYRNEASGQAYYLEGTVANNLNAATVSFISTTSDATLITQLGDPHAAGTGALSELEEWGPLGCAILAVSGDRLWGAGGQVPAGSVQFSKLKEDGEGAGFDDLAGFQVVDTEGHEVTSVHALNDVTVAHQAEKLNVIAGTGPDNYGRGAFNIPQIVLADGAITHTGTSTTQIGTLYWGQDGPRLLSTALQVITISAPIRALAETLSPSGIRVDLARHEAVWYTRSGTALLWNWLGDTSRWAEWSGLEVAGCSPESLVTTDGRLLKEDVSAPGDGGQGFPFVVRSNNLRAEELLQSATLVRATGVVGEYRGAHTLRMRVFYNGSPLWTDQFVWSPETNTWLTDGASLETLTPAQIDALKPSDKSGRYITHHRTSRQHCAFFQVELSTVNATGPTYTPYEISLELGAQGGLSRVPVQSYSTTIGR